MLNLLRKLKAFRRDADGAVAIEFAGIAPVLCVLCLGGLSLFSVQRTAVNLEENTGIIADFIAREVTVDNARLTEFHRLLMTLSERGDPADAKMAVTSVLKRLDANGDEEVVTTWTWDSTSRVSAPGTGPFTGRTVPMLGVGESALIVQTEVKKPVMLVYEGPPIRTYTNSAVLTPRFINHVENNDAPYTP